MDVNKQFAQMFQADPNISKEFRSAFAEANEKAASDLGAISAVAKRRRDTFAEALEAANTQRLADIRDLLQDSRPAMLKLIELYGAECIVVGQMMARGEIEGDA